MIGLSNIWMLVCRLHSLLFQFSFLYVTIQVIFISECIFYINLMYESSCYFEHIIFTFYKFFFSFVKVLYNNNFILKLISINHQKNLLYNRFRQTFSSFHLFYNLRIQVVNSCSATSIIFYTLCICLTE